MNVFETALVQEVKRIREKLSQVESISSFQLEIEITGRVHEGDLEVRFKLGQLYSTGGQVKGGSIEPVVLEYLRRFGWDEKHQVKLIPVFESAE
jgi:hypothetical protein